MSAPFPREEVVAIVPARMGSTRLPGKVLLNETGRPLIQHVFEAARRARVLSRVVIATDDAGVADAARGFGAEAVLTRADHPNGTSRLAEAAAALGLAPRDIVVNVQGDEPELEPEAIDAAVAALRGQTPGAQEQSDEPHIATIAVPFQPGEDPFDPNCVKVVLNTRGRALYFSRSLIPFNRASATALPAVLRHVGLYVYRREFLETYAALPPTPLEQSEQLEQLRALEHGYRIAVAIRPRAMVGIDTPEQYRAFVERWRRRGAKPNEH